MNEQSKLTIAVTTVAVLFITVSSHASVYVSLNSGAPEGDHPVPVLIGKAMRGDEIRIDIKRATALVNYPDPQKPIIVKRVLTKETGGKVTCPWYYRYDRYQADPIRGTRVDVPFYTEINHKVLCDDGCNDLNKPAVPVTALLFGRYNLQKCKNTDGSDFGFADTVMKDVCPQGGRCWDARVEMPVCCQEFTVERVFTDTYFFDNLLILDDFREQEINDLDVDLRKIYLTFENENAERTNCKISNLLKGHWIKIADLRDCQLPPGDRFVMYAQSRFYLKETRPCGKFITNGALNSKGEYAPVWRWGWYECDGKESREPIEKQFTYSTRLELEFTESKSPKAR